MEGGLGDDFFFVDDAGDTVIELAGEGDDSVYSKISYALAVGADVETLATSDFAALTAISLTGNAKAQDLIGNSGANRLDGGGGADRLIGLAGDDYYVIDNAGDVVIEGASLGADHLSAKVSYAPAAGVEVETLATFDFAATDAINLTGNAFGQDLIGNSGANRLDGGAGADRLIGLAGNDQYAFTTALGGGNIDQIIGFAVGGDKILLDDAIFSGLGLGALAAGAFRTGATAQDADDRILYDASSGALFFDADGVGGVAAIQFATLGTGLAMTASDFTVI